MTNYRPQDIVLVEFAYAENTGSKKRPALIISSYRYHQNRQEVIVMAITSNIDRILFADTKIDKWKEAGLLYPSLVTGIVRTVKGSIILRKLGILSQRDFQKVRENIRKAIALC
ncbi:MAG TPA: type II toxin-antitoxin system PemK/MazF family toxin [Candidatus Omnitrophota bacterium]|nr:type II toxin-antitoxin system PemK/MazF family toxin [Candidatus Omnitrophota bacterium]